MRKLLNNPWMVTALALLAVACVSLSLWPKRDRGVEVAALESDTVTLESSEVATEQLAVGDTANLSIERALKEIALTAVVADPFARQAKYVAEGVAQRVLAPDLIETLKVSAIWTQDGQTLLLINGQIHQAGDQIARITIESASQDGVWLAHWKGRDFLTLGTDFTLVTPATTALRAARL